MGGSAEVIPKNTYFSPSEEFWGDRGLHNNSTVLL